MYLNQGVLPAISNIWLKTILYWCRKAFFWWRTVDLVSVYGLKAICRFIKSMLAMMFEFVLQAVILVKLLRAKWHKLAL